MTQVSKRVFVTLPDTVFEELERWADSEGRATANLAAFLIELSVRQANEQGKIPPPKRIPPKGKNY